VKIRIKPLVTSKTAIKGLILTPIMLAVFALLHSTYVPAHAQSSDWTLTVNVGRVNFGDSDINKPLSGTMCGR
jgi:hypothetical protein